VNVFIETLRGSAPKSAERRNETDVPKICARDIYLYSIRYPRRIRYIEWTFPAPESRTITRGPQESSGEDTEMREERKFATHSNDRSRFRDKHRGRWAKLDRDLNCKVKLMRGLD